MATVTISEAASALAEELVRSGQFDSVGQAVEAGLHQLREIDDEEVDLTDLPPEMRAAIEEGFADLDARRVVDADTVFDRLLAKYTAVAENIEGRLLAAC